MIIWWYKTKRLLPYYRSLIRYVYKYISDSQPNNIILTEQIIYSSHQKHNILTRERELYLEMKLVWSPEMASKALIDAVKSASKYNIGKILSMRTHVVWYIYCKLYHPININEVLSFFLDNSMNAYCWLFRNIWDYWEY